MRETHFPLISSDDFSRYHLDHSLCLHSSIDTISLQGNYEDPIFNYMKIALRNCQTSDHPDCIQDYEAQKAALANRKVFVELIIVESMLDQNDFLNPVKPLIHPQPLEEINIDAESFKQTDSYVSFERLTRSHKYYR